jgi:hypothetical protein
LSTVHYSKSLHCNNLVPRIIPSIHWVDLHKNPDLKINPPHEVSRVPGNDSNPKISGNKSSSKSLILLANCIFKGNYRFYFECFVQSDSGAWAAIGAGDEEFCVHSQGVVVGRDSSYQNAGYYNESGAISWTGDTIKTGGMWSNSYIGKINQVKI